MKDRKSIFWCRKDNRGIMRLLIKSSNLWGETIFNVVIDKNDDQKFFTLKWFKNVKSKALRSGQEMAELPLRLISNL